MKKPVFRRAAAAILSLALLAGLAPAAFAADSAADAAIKSANDINNFDYEYTGHTVTADSNGMVKKTFSKPSATTNGEGPAKEGAFYAAVLPVDAGGSPVSGKDVRYVRLSESGDSLNLTYFREGCSHFRVMIVQPQPDGGDAAITASPASLTHDTSRGDSHSYTVTFTATLNMSATLAQIADLNKDDAAMENLTFTAHIRLPEGLTGDETSIKLDSEVFEFDAHSGITANPGGENGFDIKCGLKTNWSSTEPEESLVNKLQETMTFTGTASITGGTIRSLVSAGQDAVYVVGWNSIGNIPAGALGGAALQVPAAACAVPVSVQSGGSSGESASRYPVNVNNGISNGDVTADYTSTTEGTRVTITVEPHRGYRLNTLIVTDAAGNRVEVTANADGTYSFFMPARGVEITAGFAAAIADPEDTGVAGWLNTEDHTAYMVGYDTGNFGPNDNVTRAQVAMMFYRLLNNPDVPVTVTFSDVTEDTWYAQAVQTLASLGIVEGVGNGRFAPERAITRAEFCAIAARFANSPAQGTQQFSDVAETYWAHDYIATANAYGWVTGVGNNLFAPLDLISRAQAAVFVNRMTGRLADQAAIDAGSGSRFPDVDKTHWAWYDIIEATTTHGYTKGNGTETWQEGR